MTASANQPQNTIEDGYNTVSTFYRLMEPACAQTPYYTDDLKPIDQLSVVLSFLTFDDIMEFFKVSRLSHLSVVHYITTYFQFDSFCIGHFKHNLDKKILPMLLDVKKELCTSYKDYLEDMKEVEVKEPFIITIDTSALMLFRLIKTYQEINSYARFAVLLNDNVTSHSPYNWEHFFANAPPPFDQKYAAKIRNKKGTRDCIYSYHYTVDELVKQVNACLCDPELGTTVFPQFLSLYQGNIDGIIRLSLYNIFDYHHGASFTYIEPIFENEYEVPVKAFQYKTPAWKNDDEDEPMLLPYFCYFNVVPEKTAYDVIEKDKDVPKKYPGFGYRSYYVHTSIPDDCRVIIQTNFNSEQRRVLLSYPVSLARKHLFVLKERIKLFHKMYNFLNMVVFGQYKAYKVAQRKSIKNDMWTEINKFFQFDIVNLAKYPRIEMIRDRYRLYNMNYRTVVGLLHNDKAWTHKKFQAYINGDVSAMRDILARDARDEWCAEKGYKNGMLILI
jgi:hypothetical protein